jgi:hypothetical protein
VTSFAVFAGFPALAGGYDIRFFCCFLLGFSSGIDVKGDWCLMKADESVVCVFGVSMGGFDSGDVFVGFFICVGVPILHGFLDAGCVHALSNLVGLEACDIAVGCQRSFLLSLPRLRRWLRFPANIVGGLLYQLETSGWASNPTFSGGFLPLRGAQLAGVLGKSTVEASSFLFSSEEMVVGHFARLVRSADKMYVGAAGVLLFVPFQKL